MAVETHQVRHSPSVWLTGDYSSGPNGSLLSLHALRCVNNVGVAVRVKATTGRGPNTVEHALVVQPGEDRTLSGPPFPIVVAGTDLGIVVEQV